MRAAHWLAGVVLFLGGTSLHAQAPVGLTGSFSGKSTQNRPLDTKRLSTPLPEVPAAKRPFSLGSLLPRWLLPGSSSRTLPPSPKGNNPTAFQSSALGAKP